MSLREDVPRLLLASGGIGFSIAVAVSPFAGLSGIALWLVARRADGRDARALVARRKLLIEGKESAVVGAPPALPEPVAIDCRVCRHIGTKPDNRRGGER
jgi:hypothetical protein